MYLERDDLAALLSTLADSSAPASRLAINFAVPEARTFAPNRALQAGLSALGRFHGERYKSASDIADPLKFVEAAGWHKAETVNLRERARGAPASGLDVEGINPRAALISART
jgi:O-methyltransferase involved in polyketide biosynthesis